MIERDNYALNQQLKQEYFIHIDKIKKKGVDKSGEWVYNNNINSKGAADDRSAAPF